MVVFYSTHAHRPEAALLKLLAMLFTGARWSPTAITSARPAASFETGDERGQRSFASIAAQSMAPALIRGERGAGKARLAREIHGRSERARGPYVECNCASHNIEQQILMDPSLLRGASGGAGETFALRVRGDSMIEAGIYDGDILFVRRQETANRGEIVVALVGDEATVKRFYQERDHIRLQPENKRLGPIYVRRGEMGGFRILGVVVGLFRSVAGARLA